MHVTCMDRVERTRGDGEAMHASFRREHLRGYKRMGECQGVAGAGEGHDVVMLMEREHLRGTILSLSHITSSRGR